MCNSCQELEKTVVEFDDKEVNDLFEKLGTKIFNYQEEILVEMLSTYNNVYAIQKLQAFDDFFDEISKIIQSVYLYGQGIGLSIVKKETKELEVLGQLDFNVSFDIQPTYALEYANKQTGALISNIDANTQSQVQKIVTQSINEGRTQQKLSEVIYDSFSQFNKVRSALIARQETSLALGGGKYDQFVESAKNYNQVGRKRTFTQQDAKVREEHRVNADAGRIPANQPYPGTQTMYPPHDYNCRCSDEYRVFLPNEL